MDAYCVEVRKLEKHFLGIEYHHVERDINVRADILYKLGSSRAEVPCGIFVNELSKPSIKENSDPVGLNAALTVMIINLDWAQPIINYIKEEILPDDTHEADRIVRRSKGYTGADAEDLVRRYKACQYFAHHSHTPVHKIKFIPPSWSFACWGLDMVGPLPTAPCGFEYLFIAIDKIHQVD
ncbi:unnamed protein product [Urochloa humidicola]